MHEDVDQILISEQEIQAGIDRVADTITRDYQGKEFSVVSILKGSCIFASDLIRRAAQLDKGSATPRREMVGQISRADIRRIAEQKLPDLNANDLNAAERMITGTARSMGVEVED